MNTTHRQSWFERLDEKVRAFRTGITWCDRFNDRLQVVFDKYLTSKQQWAISLSLAAVVLFFFYRDLIIHGPDGLSFFDRVIKFFINLLKGGGQ